MPDEPMVRPELISLVPADRDRVLAQSPRKAGTARPAAQPISRSAMRFIWVFSFSMRTTTPTWWR